MIEFLYNYTVYDESMASVPNDDTLDCFWHITVDCDRSIELTIEMIAIDYFYECDDFVEVRLKKYFSCIMRKPALANARKNAQIRYHAG